MVEETKTIKAGSRFMIGRPAKRPEEFIAAVRSLLAELGFVRSAWLAQVYFPESGDPPHVAICLECESDSRFKEALGRVGPLAGRFLPADQFVDWVPQDGNAFGPHIRRAGFSIYPEYAPDAEPPKRGGLIGRLSSIFRGK